MQLEDPAADVEIVVNLQENRGGSNILAARLGLSVFAQLVVAKLLQKNAVSGDGKHQEVQTCPCQALSRSSQRQD